MKFSYVKFRMFYKPVLPVIFKNVPIIFTRDINPYGFGILGHEGLFDQTKLVFELTKKQFEIIPKSYHK